MINPPSGGILELREAIARHLKDFHGLHVSPEQIIIGAGTEYLYGILIQLLGFDKKYAIEDPGCHKSPKYTTATMWTVIILPWMTAASGFQNWRRKYRCHSYFPFPSVSNGYHHAYRKTIRTPWMGFKAPSRYIIEDDYDSEFRLTGQPIPTLQSIDVLEKVIYINTFHKTLAIHRPYQSIWYCRNIW